MLIDLVMVTAPAPFGSRQLISPPADVLEIAPAKVLHGAVRLQGLTSSPTPRWQGGVGCALAASVANARANTPAALANKAIGRMIYFLACAETVASVLSCRWECSLLMC